MQKVKSFALFLCLTWSFIGFFPAVANDTVFIGSDDRRPYHFGVSAEQDHDVAVLDVTLTIPYNATEVFPKWKVNISVTVRNEGSFSETFNVTAYCNLTSIDLKTIADLPPLENETVMFFWTAPHTAWWDWESDDWILSPANYTIRAEASVVDGETDVSDNVFVNGNVKVRIPGDVNGDDRVDYKDLSYFVASYKSEYGSPFYDWRCDFTGDGVVDTRDLAWMYYIGGNTNICPSWTDIGLSGASVAIPWEAHDVYPNWLVNVTVIVRNWGNRPETFAITAYCGVIIIVGMQTFSLAIGEKRTLTVIGNTTGVTPSATAYWIKVEAVMPDDIDTFDNTITDGSLKVRLPGDINGDNKVDYRDLFMLAVAYGKRHEEVGYNPNIDFSGDGKIDYEDLFALAINYGKTYT